MKCFSDDTSWIWYWWCYVTSWLAKVWVRASLFLVYWCYVIITPFFFRNWHVMLKFVKSKVLNCIHCALKFLSDMAGSHMQMLRLWIFETHVSLWSYNSEFNVIGSINRNSGYVHITFTYCFGVPLSVLAYFPLFLFLLRLLLFSEVSAFCYEHYV